MISFGAMAAWQAWLLAAAAGGIAIGLFLLKVRPPRVSVPSLMLWTRVLNDTREQTLWERIRRAVSLAVTAIVALALAFAFLRPARTPRSADATTAAGAPARLLVVIDSSWSMLARTRSGETRWERAIAEARRVASSAGGGEVAVGTTADGLIEGPTTDLTLIDAALDRLAPSAGGGSNLPTLTGADVHLITDGAAPRAIDRAVVVHSVHEPAANAGITAFDVRAALDGAAATEAYLEVANFGPAQKVRITVTRGDTSLLDKTADMGSGEALQQVLRIPRDGAPALRARVSAPRDALEADNEAFGWMQEARQLTIAVVGGQTTWLTRSIAGSGVKARFSTPDMYKPGDEDVVIFDRYVPAEAPARPALYIAPSASSWLGTTTDRIEQKPKWMTAGTNPVLDGVDPVTFSIDRARVYETAALQPIARSAGGSALVLISDQPDRPRAVVLAFGPTDSNLASAPGFPVLMGNTLDWLGRPLVITARRTGRTAFDEKITRVADPRGGTVPLLKLPGETSAVLAAPGLYTAEAGSVRATFAVNIIDPDVSNLERTTIDASKSVVLVTAGLSPRPWWVYLVVVGFALVLLEWWTWLRRITV